MSRTLSVLSSSILAATLLYGQDNQKHVIYQILVDRFFDGDATNNDPSQSSGLYDATKTNWELYWGGDLKGIEEKIPYLHGLGVTALWITPVTDAVNVNVATGATPGAAYHGYHVRDFGRIEEHFADSTGSSWAAFDRVIAAAHANGMKVFLDIVPNHSNRRTLAEFGRLYDNGALIADYLAEDDGSGNCTLDPLSVCKFHHTPNIADSNSRYQVEYRPLRDLADFNQENAFISDHLKNVAAVFQSHGVDGFRIDAIKHITWGWWPSYANSIWNNGASFVFGEWSQGSTDVASNPLFFDSYKSANRSGVSLLDFPLFYAMRDVFVSDQSFSRIDDTVTDEAAVFNAKNSLVTFLESHDAQRFLSLRNDATRYHMALAFQLTSRGVPAIYYGSENYLHNDTNGGNTPYNRPMMTNFSTGSTAYTLINRLSGLRQANPALAYGSMSRISPAAAQGTVYVFKRVFFNNAVVVAINKGTSGYNLSGQATPLPPGAYTDYLNGAVGGQSVTIAANGTVSSLTLPANSVSVWSYADGQITAQIGAILPITGQPGMNVTINGSGFGTGAGTVKFGTTAATVVSWSPSSVTVQVPSVAANSYRVTLTTLSGQLSANDIGFTVLTGQLVPVTFFVNNAAPTVNGDYIYLTGTGTELGQWATTTTGAVGPMLTNADVWGTTCQYPKWCLTTSVPAGVTVQFKFIRIKADGSVTWEAGSNHSYAVPASGVGKVTVNWQY